MISGPATQLCRWPGDMCVERVTRIELALSAWEADVLPLNYTRVVCPATAGAAAYQSRRPARHAMLPEQALDRVRSPKRDGQPQAQH